MQVSVVPEGDPSRREFVQSLRLLRRRRVIVGFTLCSLHRRQAEVEVATDDKALGRALHRFHLKKARSRR